MNKDEIRQKLRDNVLLFGKICMTNTFTLPSPPCHREWANLYHDKSIKLANVIAPRHHAKSSILAEAMPLHHIMFEDGRKVVVIVSKSLQHATDRLQAIKDVLDYSKEFRSIFGYWGRNSAIKWTEHMVQLKDGSVIVAKGTGQQIIGMKFGAQRPTFEVLDDPEDENNTRTKESMDKNLNILLKGMMPGVDAKKGRIFVIGTPQNELCMVERIKEMSNWENLHYDAIVNEDKKEVLWPELWPWHRLDATRQGYEDIGKTSVWYSEYRCKIIGDEDQLFKPAYIHWWRGELIFEENYPLLEIQAIDGQTFDKPKKIAVNVGMGVDPASSTLQHADYSTVVPVAMDANDRRFVLPYFRKRVPPMQLADGIVKWYTKYKPSRTKIETTGYQEMLRDYLRNLEGVHIPGLERKIQPRSSKSARLETMQPFFSRGKVFLHEGQEEMRSELLMYPRGKHDDLLDGLYYAMMGLYSPDHGYKDSVLTNIWRQVSRRNKWKAV